MFQKILQLVIWKKKTGFKGVLNIVDIHKYLMKRTWYKVIFGLIKKIFIGLLTDIVSA